MVKVSIVMPVYNASRFLNGSVNSILNQTLPDLELICVDDGSTDNSLEILKEFENKDDRVKVYSLKHEGGGNARNYGLSKITGEYLFCMDADDLLDPNAFEDFYKIAEEKNLDFLMFKATNYGVEKDHYFETEYQNMSSIKKLVKDNVFSYSDLEDLLFDINVSPWCKFYNSQFIKGTGARFRENSKFHDNQFFWDMIFQAERIYFIDEFYYTRFRYDQSLTASGNQSHMDMIGVTNDIVKLFIKHGELENYEHELYNLKVNWVADRYSQVNEEFRDEYYTEMKKDFENLPEGVENLLNDRASFIYHCVLITKDYMEFDLLQSFDNKNSLDKIENLNKKISIKDELNKELANDMKDCIKTIKKDKIKIDNLKSHNDYLLTQNRKLSMLNLELIDEIENKNKIRNMFKRNKKKLL